MLSVRIAGIQRREGSFGVRVIGKASWRSNLDGQDMAVHREGTGTSGWYTAEDLQSGK